MSKIDKVKVTVRERVEDNVCDLSLSELSEVPVREIASFKRVTILDLSSNRLLTLGKNFSMLTRLIKLDLSKNQIKYLPYDFGLLRNLRHLDLYDNKLEHLPLSFGNLYNLRYLDLKGNPLMAALGKIVGHCLTTKDCQNSARNTVKFLAHMQLEAEKEKERYILENIRQQSTEVGEMDKDRDVKRMLEEEMEKSHNSRKFNKKTKQTKPNKAFNQNTAIDSSVQQSKSGANNKSIKSYRKYNNAKSSGTKMGPYSKSSAALTSIIIFLLLLAINVLLIYMITFKNPEIADKLVEFISPQYRDWILTKTEIFRLRVSDWIEQFRTTPEEN